jgi:hypothetical protein
MKKSELEYKTLEIVGRVQKHQPMEDSAVELKSEWPGDPAKTARRLAAHANSLRGEPILWIIGLDETRGVVGADDQELSVWLGSVSACFDTNVSPSLLLNLVVPVPDSGKAVVALYFETDRVPYVVKNTAYGKPDGGAVELEVPWREGNSTRTARRADLLRLLVPILHVPGVEILKAEMECVSRPSESTGSLTWELEAELYLVPRDQQVVYLPHHKCRGSFDDRYSGTRIWFRPFKIGSRSTDTIRRDDSQVSLLGPGTLWAEGKAQTPWRSAGYPDAVVVHLALGLANSDGHAIGIDMHLARATASQNPLVWTYAPPGTP